MSQSLLILDKSPSVQSMIASALQESDLSLVQEWQEDRYFETAKHISPDLIFISNSDHKQGYRVCKQIKQDEQLGKVPLVLVADSRDKIDVNTLESLGIAGFIRKPFESNTLMQEISQHLQQNFDGVHSQDFETSQSLEGADEVTAPVSVFDDEMLGLISGAPETQAKLEEQDVPDVDFSDDLEEVELTEEDQDTPLLSEIDQQDDLATMASASEDQLALSQIPADMEEVDSHEVVELPHNGHAVELEETELEDAELEEIELEDETEEQQASLSPQDEQEPNHQHEDAAYTQSMELQDEELEVELESEDTDADDFGDSFKLSDMMSQEEQEDELEIDLQDREEAAAVMADDEEAEGLALEDDEAAALLEDEFQEEELQEEEPQDTLELDSNGEVEIDLVDDEELSDLPLEEEAEALELTESEAEDLDLELSAEDVVEDESMLVTTDQAAEDPLELVSDEDELVLDEDTEADMVLSPDSEVDLMLDDTEEDLVLDDTEDDLDLNEDSKAGLLLDDDSDKVDDETLLMDSTDETSEGMLSDDALDLDLVDSQDELDQEEDEFSQLELADADELALALEDQDDEPIITQPPSLGGKSVKDDEPLDDEDVLLLDSLQSDDGQPLQHASDQWVLRDEAEELELVEEDDEPQAEAKGIPVVGSLEDEQALLAGDEDDLTALLPAEERQMVVDVPKPPPKSKQLPELKTQQDEELQRDALSDELAFQESLRSGEEDMDSEEEQGADLTRSVAGTRQNDVPEFEPEVPLVEEVATPPNVDDLSQEAMHSLKESGLEDELVGDQLVEEDDPSPTMATESGLVSMPEMDYDDEDTFEQHNAPFPSNEDLLSHEQDAAILQADDTTLEDEPLLEDEPPVQITPTQPQHDVANMAVFRPEEQGEKSEQILLDEDMTLEEEAASLELDEDEEDPYDPVEFRDTSKASGLFSQTDEHLETPQVAPPKHKPHAPSEITLVDCDDSSMLFANDHEVSDDALDHLLEEEPDLQAAEAELMDSEESFVLEDNPPEEFGQDTFTSPEAKLQLRKGLVDIALDENDFEESMDTDQLDNGDFQLLREDLIDIDLKINDFHSESLNRLMEGESIQEASSALAEVDDQSTEDDSMEDDSMELALDLDSNQEEMDMDALSMDDYEQEDDDASESLEMDYQAEFPDADEDSYQEPEAALAASTQDSEEDSLLEGEETLASNAIEAEDQLVLEDEPELWAASNVELPQDSSMTVPATDVLEGDVAGLPSSAEDQSEPDLMTVTSEEIYEQDLEAEEKFTMQADADQDSLPPEADAADSSMDEHSLRYDEETPYAAVEFPDEESDMPASEMDIKRLEQEALSELEELNEEMSDLEQISLSSQLDQELDSEDDQDELALSAMPAEDEDDTPEDQSLWMEEESALTLEEHVDEVEFMASQDPEIPLDDSASATMVEDDYFQASHGAEESAESMAMDDSELEDDMVLNLDDGSSDDHLLQAEALIEDEMTDADSLEVHEDSLEIANDSLDSVEMDSIEMESSEDEPFSFEESEEQDELLAEEPLTLPEDTIAEDDPTSLTLPEDDLSEDSLLMDDADDADDAEDSLDFDAVQEEADQMEYAEDSLTEAENEIMNDSQAGLELDGADTNLEESSLLMDEDEFDTGETNLDTGLEQEEDLMMDESDAFDELDGDTSAHDEALELDLTGELEDANSDPLMTEEESTEDLLLDEGLDSSHDDTLLMEETSFEDEENLALSADSTDLEPSLESLDRDSMVAELEPNLEEDLGLVADEDTAGLFPISSDENDSELSMDHTEPLTEADLAAGAAFEEEANAFASLEEANLEPSFHDELDEAATEPSLTSHTMDFAMDAFAKDGLDDDSVELDGDVIELDDSADFEGVVEAAPSFHDELDATPAQRESLAAVELKDSGLAEETGTAMGMEFNSEVEIRETEELMPEDEDDQEPYAISMFPAEMDDVETDLDTIDSDQLILQVSTGGEVDHSIQEHSGLDSKLGGLIREMIANTVKSTLKENLTRNRELESLIARTVRDTLESSLPRLVKKIVENNRDQSNP